MKPLSVTQPGVSTPLRNAAWLSTSFAAAVVYLFSGLLVFGGVVLGHDFFGLPDGVPERAKEKEYHECCVNWDGWSYARIAERGYEYAPDRASNVAFFPLLPMLAAGIHRLTGVSVPWSLLLISNGCLVGAFAVLREYVQDKTPATGPAIAEVAVLAMSLWPTSFFFRMAYTESLFLLLTLLMFLGIQRGWNLFVLALIVGLATATRPVGVALLPIFAWHVWSMAGRSTMNPLGLVKITALIATGCSGIAAYAGYLQLRFGDGLAFFKTQANWGVAIEHSVPRRVLGLLVFEPGLAVYNSESIAYWARYAPNLNPVFSLRFANPLWFCLTAALVLFGTWKGWLSRSEWVLSWLLLLIPYLSHSESGVMMGQGRYASIVFPIYLVVARLVQPAPRLVTIGLFCVSGALLAAYSALFAAWYRMI